MHMHTPTTHSGRPSPLAPSILLALLLAACGGGSDGGGGITPTPADPLASYKNQVVAWGSCQQYLAQDSDGNWLLHVAALGERLQCADIKAPLDYQQPEGAQISLSMMRILAVDSPQKKPNLFFNPGGPGGDGQKIGLLYYSRLLGDGRKDTELGDLYREMNASYNFVGFSPRGVGASTNIACAGNERVYQTDDTKWGKTPENIRRMIDYARYTASNCQKNPVVAHIHTEATARDMDLMRHLLGDEKLHYYGISYGTWLGMWYAGIFPEKIGPMVLDSNVNFGKPMHDAWIAYLSGVVHTFLNHSAPYAARHDAIFGLGTTAQAVIENLNTISHEVNWALLKSGVQFKAEPERIHQSLIAIKMAVEMQKMIQQNKTLLDIEKELLDRQYFPDPEMNQVFLDLINGTDKLNSMVKLVASFRDANFFRHSKNFSLDNIVRNAVECNDGDFKNKDQAYWVDKGFEMAGQLPIVHGNLASQPCIYWQRQVNIQKPAMASLATAPVLMLQSEFDVPTPLSGAMETFDQLPAASMVYVKNEGSHGMPVYGTQCVDGAVMGYLLGRKPAQRLTQCQGKPLPLDATSAKAAGQKSLHSGDQDLAHFQNPELARQLLQQLRQAM